MVSRYGTASMPAGGGLPALTTYFDGHLHERGPLSSPSLPQLLSPSPAISLNAPHFPHLTT